MIFDRLIAFPESRRILKMHLASAPFMAMQTAMLAMIPVLLRDYFRAGEWQTTISTAAIPMMLLLSILWNELYRRVDPHRYLQVVWMAAMVPLAGIAFCYRAETLLACLLVSSAGFGAMTPIGGDILRSCYPPSIRSRVFSLYQGLSQATVMVAAYGIGRWLDWNTEAFRTYLPIGVLLIGVGMWLLMRITRERLFLERHRVPTTEPLRKGLSGSLRNMVRVLVNDASFRRHEAAFFVYGLGWMICAALLPFLVVDFLQLNYEQVARSTQTALQLAMLLSVIPVGMLMDRIGPIRTAGWSFGLLAIYPLGLIVAEGTNSLTVITLAYGICISGVNLAWTVGPVTLARDAAQAPHYLAIHAALVGVRAILGQFPAVLLYKWTGDLRIPLALAAVFFASGGLLMLRLDRDRRAAQRLSAFPVVAPSPREIP